ncbi:MAG: EamA family transporter [Kiritimatiellaeota bacterium]|nr:EamA family transporter [Kiritimatiellota bacterium]
MWMVYALLGALFAAATAVLAKIGMEGVNASLATAVRTVVVLAMTWGIVFALGLQQGLETLTRRNWLFLILSGVATGLSWLFNFAALKGGDVSKVAPIDKSSLALTMALAFLFLGEKITLPALVGGGLVTAGMLVLVFWK